MPEVMGVMPASFPPPAPRPFRPMQIFRSSPLTPRAGRQQQAPTPLHTSLGAARHTPSPPTRVSGKLSSGNSTGGAAAAAAAHLLEPRHPAEQETSSRVRRPITAAATVVAAPKLVMGPNKGGGKAARTAGKRGCTTWVYVREASAMPCEKIIDTITRSMSQLR